MLWSAWYAGDRAKGLDDDPRWTAANTAYRAAFDAEEAAACAIAHARPTSLGGAAALLRYAYEHEALRCEWPDGEDQQDADIGWHGALHRSLAAALAALTAYHHLPLPRTLEVTDPRRDQPGLPSKISSLDEQPGWTDVKVMIS